MYVLWTKKNYKWGECWSSFVKWKVNPFVESSKETTVQHNIPYKMLKLNIPATNISWNTSTFLFSNFFMTVNIIFSRNKKNIFIFKTFYFIYARKFKNLRQIFSQQIFCWKYMNAGNIQCLNALEISIQKLRDWKRYFKTKIWCYNCFIHLIDVPPTRLSEL